MNAAASDARTFWVRVAGPAETARELLAQRPETAGIEPIDGQLKVTLAGSVEDGGYIADTLVKGGIRLLELREDEIGLEEVFLRVTKGETQ